VVEETGVVHEELDAVAVLVVEETIVVLRGIRNAQTGVVGATSVHTFLEGGAGLLVDELGVVTLTRSVSRNRTKNESVTYRNFSEAGDIAGRAGGDIRLAQWIGRWLALVHR
jgi:hypothetical protein